MKVNLILVLLVISMSLNFMSFTNQIKPIEFESVSSNNFTHNSGDTLAWSCKDSVKALYKTAVYLPIYFKMRLSLDINMNFQNKLSEDDLRKIDSLIVINQEQALSSIDSVIEDFL